MASKSELGELIWRLRNGRLTRREFAGRALLAGVAASALPALLAACGGDDDDDAPEAATSTSPSVTGQQGQSTATSSSTESPARTQPAGEGQRGGTLTVARPIDSVALDPHKDITGPSAYVYSNLYETLVKLNTSMELEPGLAESWEQIEPERWRFTLRQGVKFHDGTDFTAEAVKFTIERTKNPEDPGLTQSHLAPITAVEPQDDFTVDIVTDGPIGPILRILSWGASGGIVSPAAVEEHGEDFPRNPSGTGPFKFVEWQANTSITLERWEDYWGEKAYLDRVIFTVVPEESSRMLAIRTGEAQMAQVPAPSELAALATDNQFKVYEAPADRVLYFGFHTRHAPVDDINVRRAIAHAFNAEPIMEFVLEGAGLPATAIISPVVFGHTDVSEYFSYDPTRAEELLTEAGWARGSDGVWAKDGQPLVIRHQTPRGRYLKDAEASEAFQAQMREFGITIDLQVLEWGTMFGGLRQEGGADAEMFTLGWSTAIADADFGPRLMYHSDFIVPNGLNYTMYSNPELDELVIQGQHSTDPDERKTIYAQVLEILASDMVSLPIFTMKALAVSTAAVQGFEIHPNDFNFWLDKTWIES